MYKFNDKTYTTEALSNIASVKGYSLDELLAKNPSIVLEENTVDDENTDESGKPTGVQEGSRRCGTARGAPRADSSTRAR